jgi:hypothetical protein
VAGPGYSVSTVFGIAGGLLALLSLCCVGAIILRRRSKRKYAAKPEEQQLRDRLGSVPQLALPVRDHAEEYLSRLSVIIPSTSPRHQSGASPREYHVPFAAVLPEHLDETKAVPPVIRKVTSKKSIRIQFVAEDDVETEPPPMVHTARSVRHVKTTMKLGNAPVYDIDATTPVLSRKVSRRQVMPMPMYTLSAFEDVPVAVKKDQPQA